VAVEVLPDRQEQQEKAPAERSTRNLMWMWPPGFHPARAYLIVFAISTFVVSRWFRAGTFIATGDMGPFIRQGWEPGVLWGWSYQITGAGSATHTIGRAFEFLLIAIAQTLGFDETMAQWMFYTIIYGLVGFGVAYAAGAVVRSEWGIVMAGTFAVLNGFFLTRIPNPLNIISVGTVALITGIVFRVAQGRTVPAPIAGFAFMPVSFLAFNPPMFVVATIWAGFGAPVVAVALYGRKAIWRLVKWYVMAGPWLVILNLWWLIPFLQVYTGGGGAQSNAAFTDPTNWTWSQVNNQVPNILTLSANWAWYLPQYLPFASDLDQPYWIWTRYMQPVLIFAAPLAALAARRRISMVLLGMAGLFVFLAKGLMPPLVGVNMFLYMNVPMFWLFREPMSKLGQLLVTFFGILMAILVEGVISRWRENRPKPARWPRHVPRPATLALSGTIFASIAALAWPYPVFAGTVIPDERPMQPAAHVRVPQFWWDTAEVINKDPSPGKVLVLPLDDYYQMPTKWGFFGVDSISNLLLKKGVIQPKPDGYFGDVPGYAADVRAIQTGLLSGDLTAVPRMLDATGIDTIIVRHDLVNDMPGRTFADNEVITKALERVPGVKRIQQGDLDIWKADPAAGEQVRAYNKILSVGARPDAAAAVIGSVGTGTAAIALQSSEKPPLQATVDDRPMVTNDTVQWPVPAVEEGTPKTTVKLLPGDYVVAQRARAAAVLVPSLDTANKQLVFTDRTKVRIDGEVVSQRPPLKVDVPTTDIVAVQMGPRAVSLDGWGREAMPRKPGAPVQPASAPVGAATPLVAFAPSTKPAEPFPPSEVYDCNNYEPRPADELKLRKQVLRNADGEFLRLSAIDHAACTRIEIPDAKPGRTYRVRLEYRMVQGKRPQICLWQVGTDGCVIAPRPMMNAGWHPYERIITVDKGTDKLILVLHADVGERLLGKTVTDYRNISIEALDPVLKTEIWPPEVPQRSIRLDGGKHELSVTGGLSGTALAEFEPLQDCFRYDDKTTEQAGLVAKVEGDLRDPTITLGARDHMACLGSTVPDMGQSSLYKLSVDSRSINNRNPKFCLYLRGPDACEKIPTAGPWIKGEWSPYSTLIGPNRKAVETRVYVYGLRDFEGQEQSFVEYKNIRLTPVASPSSVVLVRQTYGGVPDVMDGRTVEAQYKRVNPIRTKVEVGAGAALVGFTETGAKGWSLTGHGGATPAQGWMASWKVEGQPVEGTIQYLPAGLGRKALYLLPPALLMSFLALLFGAWWRRRRARRAAAA
jgi:arabinofuranan 3-O-arabinosyltransferase